MFYQTQSRWGWKLGNLTGGLSSAASWYLATWASYMLWNTRSRTTRQREISTVQNAGVGSPKWCSRNCRHTQVCSYEDEHPFFAKKPWTSTPKSWNRAALDEWMNQEKMFLLCKCKLPNRENPIFNRRNLPAFIENFTAGLRASPRFCHILLGISCILLIFKKICQVKKEFISNSLA